MQYSCLFCLQVIQLEFLSFAVGLFRDRVNVYDGGNSMALMLGTFTGFTIPNNVISTNNSLFVSFHSDGSQKLDGFEIKYTAVQLEPGKQQMLVKQI